MSFPAAFYAVRLRITIHAPKMMSRVTIKGLDVMTLLNRGHLSRNVSDTIITAITGIMTISSGL